MTNITTQNDANNEAETRIYICRDKRSRILDLSDIGLTSIPKAVKDIRNLEVLKLNENAISELPDFIDSLKDIEYLDLSYNKLSVLPQSIGSLLFLKTLNVRCNKLKSIPESIEKLVSLRSLDISYNRLSELPETINNLLNLKYCNIKGNNLRSLPEKIAELIKSKQISLLGHIERIIELTGNDGLSEGLSSVAKPHIEYITQKLHITPIQAVIFSHIVSAFDYSPVGMQEIANSINCNRIKLMQYINDFEELEHRKIIRSSKKERRGHGYSGDISDYSIPREVIKSLMKDEEYQPTDQSNLSITELFTRMESLFEQRVDDNDISYDELSASIIELLNNNKQLPFVKEVCGYELSKENLMLLLRFCHKYINREQEELSLDDISAMYDRKSQFSYHRRQFKSGEHILMSRGFIEYTNSEGFGNRELFKLAETTRKGLLADLQIKSLRNRRDIIRASVIQEKKLFYNGKESGQVAQLTSLLEKSSFNEIQSRLSDNGMRTGFACLFSGIPGTGKTETVYQIARQTGRDIMAVDISKTKSMWFGESEKIIKEIFTRYRDFVEEIETAPILLFNEADAIFGKRKDVSSGAVDQTENAIQNIILQELENLKGILIATTNLAENLDNAFERRFLYKIEFKKPELAIRQSIWQSVIPTISNENIRELATRFDFSGGQIENIARKRTVELVLSGTEPNLDKLIFFCEEERLNKDMSKRIGFSV
jgi:hypothetical protein